MRSAVIHHRGHRGKQGRRERADRSRGRDDHERGAVAGAEASICGVGPPRKAVPTQAREESDRINGTSTDGRNANYTEGCDEKPDRLRANGWDAVAGRVR
jgi:hypothetical protein